MRPLLVRPYTHGPPYGAARTAVPYGSPVMCLHHLLVVVAQATFLLTQYPGFYMAASGALFELTNVFFIPHVLMIQLEVHGTWPLLNGLMLVLVYTVARVGACTSLAVLSVYDLRHFAPTPPGGWLAACVGLACFYGLLCMSWYWYMTSILPALHSGIVEAFGEEYYHACVPASLRQLAWRVCSPEGREAEREAKERLVAMQQLRNELQREAHAGNLENHEPIL